MVLARTSYRVWGTTHAPHAIGSPAVPSQRVQRPHNSSACTMFRRLLAAIVNGSKHPCLQTSDAWTQLGLLPPREQNRLLDSGRVTRER